MPARLRRTTAPSCSWGPSGAGKSTLAAELVRRGHPLQADDIAPIVLDSGRPEVVPGFPQLKLALDAAEHLDQPQAGRGPGVRPGEAKLSVLSHDRFPTVGGCP